MTAPFDAFHFPASAGVQTGGGGDDTVFRTLRAGELQCRYPDPDPALLRRAIAALGAAGEALATMPMERVIRAIDGAAARLGDPTDPLRKQAEALLPRATGYAPEMIRLVLDRMTADWRGDALRRVLDIELGGSAALVGYVPRGPRTAATAIGPGLAFHVFSGNVPGVAVTSLVRALLVRSPSLGKLAAGEPVLPVLFARALADVEPAVGEAVAVAYWPGGEAPEAERTVLEVADTVIVYGGDAAVQSIRARVTPEQRLVLHGPRLSLGAVGSGDLEGGLEGAASRAARAVATFDQQGCVSPHAIWVEGDAARASAFAELLGGALESLTTELPRGTITTAEASAIQQERGAAELRAHADPAIRLWTGEGTGWTVVLEPGERIRASCLNRFVRVHPLDDLSLLPPLGAGHRGRIQSVALEGAGPRDPILARQLARAGVTRITTFDRLPWPPPHAHHDGAPPLRELIRWTDRET